MGGRPRRGTAGRPLAQQGADNGVMEESRHVVARQVDVRLDGGDAYVQGGFKGGQSVFRFQAAGAAVAAASRSSRAN
jgi:hypothetical protein